MLKALGGDSTSLDAVGPRVLCCGRAPSMSQKSAEKVPKWYRFCIDGCAN
jgi:hypothetical protein